ncbi:MAG: DUF3299 domain-containing protein [Pseudochelatococcus sp.]|jgi:hypothetical protein|uniref:DUF3299 domain-containing protein n=1 Tax=Pseudochelatococcus sp. TaxID=2020869 RepID=UPI003D89D08D
MMNILLSRRGFGIGLSAVLLPAGQARAREVIELTWDDLLPQGAAPLAAALRGVVQHEAATLAQQQPVSSGFRTDWNGKTVRMPGFVVPLDHAGVGVTTFILVPYVGACIHVPPPPANQLVLVTTKRPYEIRDLFDPVKVTGVLSASETATELAEIGYALSAERIEAHKL